MNEDELAELLQYLRTSVHFSRHLGLQIEEVEPGRSVFSVELSQMHMNGAGTVHGGVHAALMDSAMAVALIALKLRVATTQMNLHYLEPTSGGRIVCRAQVMHRTRRNATAEAKIHDERGKLLAAATASFRVFDRQPGELAGTTTATEGTEG